MVGNYPNPFPVLIIICLIVGLIIGGCTVKSCQYLSNKFDIKIEKKVEEK